MNTHEAIRTRRTAHRWLATPVPEDVIQRGLEAAHCAPCHRLTWPWRFTLPGPAAREALLDVGARLKAAKKGVEITDAYRQKMFPKLRNPALVVVSQVLADDVFTREEDYAASSCAIQNLCLSVHADGYHSKWSTGGLTRHVDTYQLLGIDAELERIIGFIWIGVPTRTPNAPPRPDLSEHIRRLA